MKKIVVVLDSCRLDSYKGANTKEIDQYIGKVIPSYTATNHTITSFMDFLYTNKMPQPVGKPNNPWFKKDFNYIENVDEPIYFFSDNAHLDPVNLHVKALLKMDIFKEYKVFEPWFGGCQKILDAANKVDLGDDYFLILWFGETHQPFNYGKNINTGWKSFVKRVAGYNNGYNSITQKEMDVMHKRQEEACGFIIQKLWNEFLHAHRDAEIVITSNHGESFGENHIYGHGNDIHKAQFLVPFVTNKKVKF